MAVECSSSLYRDWFSCFSRLIIFKLFHWFGSHYFITSHQYSSWRNNLSLQTSIVVSQISMNIIDGIVTFFAGAPNSISLSLRRSREWYICSIRVHAIAPYLPLLSRYQQLLFHYSWLCNVKYKNKIDCVSRSCIFSLVFVDRRREMQVPKTRYELH